MEHRTPGGLWLSASLSSGYQHFVLSLAARLAIWRLARAPRPDAMVIDEGFGACDEDYLDALAGALEALAGAPGGPRLVFIVSHVDGLKVALRASARNRTGPHGKPRNERGGEASRSPGGAASSASGGAASSETGRARGARSRRSSHRPAPGPGERSERLCASSAAKACGRRGGSTWPRRSTRRRRRGRGGGRRGEVAAGRRRGERRGQQRGKRPFWAPRAPTPRPHPAPPIQRSRVPRR